MVNVVIDPPWAETAMQSLSSGTQLSTCPVPRKVEPLGACAPACFHHLHSLLSPPPSLPPPPPLPPPPLLFLPLQASEARQTHHEPAENLKRNISVLERVCIVTLLTSLLEAFFFLSFSSLVRLWTEDRLDNNEKVKLKECAKGVLILC